MTPAEFQPLLSEFPTLDLTWPAAVRAAWLLRHPVHTAMEEPLEQTGTAPGASEGWVQFAAPRQLARRLHAEADAQKQAATG